MNHRFQCQCGAVTGEVDHPERSVRAVCYCSDCQTYAHLLGHPERVLDELGGTDVIATQSSNVRFTSGTQALTCLSLSPGGLLRWYASCCGTPIANTPRDWKLPYAGLVHTCLRQPEPMERSFPRVQLRVNTKRARARPPRDNSVAGMVSFARVVLGLVASRLRGGYRASPFFRADGSPVADVAVAPRERVDAARRASTTA
jgi:hypothetical protein